MRTLANAVIGALNGGFIATLAHTAGLTGLQSFGCVALSFLFMTAFAAVIAL